MKSRNARKSATSFVESAQGASGQQKIVDSSEQALDPSRAVADLTSYGSALSPKLFLNWIQPRKEFRGWILLRIDGSSASTLNSTSITISTLELVKEFGKPNSSTESNIEKDSDVEFY